jgi:hypothetical protein
MLPADVRRDFDGRLSRRLANGVALIGKFDGEFASLWSGSPAGRRLRFSSGIALTQRAQVERQRDPRGAVKDQRNSDE